MLANTWQVEQLRLTTFGLPSFEQRKAEHLFSKFVGREADSITHQRELALAEEGAYHDGVLKIVQQAERIDVFYEAMEVWPSWLGAFQERSPDFFTDAVKFCGNLPAEYAPFRVAIGVVLAQPVATKDEGYEIVSRILGIKLPTGGRDLLFQLNEPTTDDDVELNRLKKWSVSQYQRGKIEVSFLTGAAKMIGQDGDVRYAVRLELDFSSTAESRSKVSRENVCATLKRLADCAKVAAEEDHGKR